MVLVDFLLAFAGIGFTRIVLMVGLSHAFCLGGGEAMKSFVLGYPRILIC